MAGSGKAHLQGGENVVLHVEDLVVEYRVKLSPLLESLAVENQHSVKRLCR